MSKEDAYALFEAIAEINGLSDKLHLVEPTKMIEKKRVLQKRLAMRMLAIMKNII